MRAEFNFIYHMSANQSFADNFNFFAFARVHQQLQYTRLNQWPGAEKKRKEIMNYHLRIERIIFGPDDAQHASSDGEANKLSSFHTTHALHHFSFVRSPPDKSSYNHDNNNSTSEYCRIIAKRI